MAHTRLHFTTQRTLDQQWVYENGSAVLHHSSMSYLSVELDWAVAYRCNGHDGVGALAIGGGLLHPQLAV
jgi:hypothetical protein